METGRMAVVTGGAQGIGRAISLALREDGWDVLAVDLDGEALAELPEGIGRLELDVAQDNAPEILRAALSEGGALHLLVHNAGIFDATPIGAQKLATFDRILSVNLRAPYALTLTCLEHLRRAGGASVIHISSTRALQSEPGTEAYAASKGGLLALTHALALSLGGEGVRVNAVLPGWIATEEWQKEALRHAPELRPEDHLQHPAGRVGGPEDIARAVLFLADPRSDFITGTALVVDGGMTRKMIYLP